MTSHDVVFKTRKILKTKKIGHTGTLDPEAEGVLVLCIGRATKMVEYITDHQKVYEAEVVLGLATDTCDTSGTILCEEPHRGITRAQFEKILAQFTGEISQTPPIYSAIRVNGKKLYHYARNGEAVEIPSRRVEISAITLLEFDEMTQRGKIMVACSKGTYMRSLCRDIALALGTCGCMGRLIRHQVGGFVIDQALRLSEIEAKLAADQLDTHIYPLAYSLDGYQKVTATEEGRKFLINGNKLFQWNVRESFADFEPSEIIRLYDNEELVGMGRFFASEEEKYVKPSKLL